MGAIARRAITLTATEGSLAATEGSLAATEVAVAGRAITLAATDGSLTATEGAAAGRAVTLAATEGTLAATAITVADATDTVLQGANAPKGAPQTLDAGDHAPVGRVMLLADLLRSRRGPIQHVRS